MSGSTSHLQDARGFTRGFLLALEWAGQAPDPEVTRRVPRLGGEDLTALYRALRSLPSESRRALRVTWAKRERLQRVDEAVDLHPSWMVEALQGEPLALFLLALGELEPGLARSVLRELWSKKRPKPNEVADDLRPLSPAHAGAFRRHLYGSWVHLPVRRIRSADDPGASGPKLDPVLGLDAGQVWLLAQECGRKELEALGGRLVADHPSSRVRAAHEAGGDENERIGLLGLQLLSSLLARHPRDYALHLAQRMPLPLARSFLRWRDAQAAEASDRSGNEGVDRNGFWAEIAPHRVEELMERARALCAERSRGERT